MKLLRIAAIVLALVTAGCVTAPAADHTPGATIPDLSTLSAARFEALGGESVFYEGTADGTQLHLRLWRPDTTEPAPAILVMSPYFGPDSREGADPNDPTTWDPTARPAYWRYAWLIDHFVPRGYAVAFADVRGTGESGGCLEQTGPLQTQDGYDTVEWLAAQPWSNGRVGMYGKSYDGETQQATATLAPPHLTTIVPVSSVAGQYDYSYYDGVPYTLQTMLSNVGYAAGDGLQPGSTAEAHLAFPERAGCNKDHFAQGADDSGTWTPYWEEREFRMQAENVTASVLYVHGLQDWNVKPSNIRDWFERLDVPKAALLGQWEHDYPEENRFAPEWSRQDWQELVWRWYDHWLLGREVGIETMLGTVQVQDNEGVWRGQSAFPATGATPAQFSWAEEKRYQEPPLARFGTLSTVLPTDVRYETDPLAADVRWSGWPTLTLDVTIDKDDAHFAVLLLDVAPDGTQTWVNRAYLSAQHANGLREPEPVTPGERTTYELRFFPSDTVVRAGHKLALVIAPYDDWTSGAGNAHTATIHAATLTIPDIAALPLETLAVPMGEPITKPVT